MAIIVKITRLNGLILAIIIIAISISVFAIIISNYNSQKIDTLPRPEIIDKNISPAVSSGPLTVLNSKFKLGENVFFTVNGLKENEAGVILVFSPGGKLYQSYTFNGSQKTDFNAYFKPDTTRSLQLCTPEDITGNWTIVLQGTNYNNLKFEMLPEILRGSESDIIQVC